MLSVIPSQNLRRELRWTQDPTPHPRVSHGGSSASSARQSATTSTDQGTGTSDAAPAGSEEHVEETKCGTAKREPREVRVEQSSTIEQDVPRRLFLKTTPQGHAVAVITHEALNWVSGEALDMTHCDFSARAARDEMRHIIGSSEPDVIIGSDKDRNRECRKKDKDHKKKSARAERGAGCARPMLRARADVRSELGNEVCSEDHGHAGNESDSGRSLHVRVGCV